MRYLLCQKVYHTTCNVKARMQYKLILLVVKSMIFFSLWARVRTTSGLYRQSVSWRGNEKNNVFPCITHFYHVEVRSWGNDLQGRVGTMDILSPLHPFLNFPFSKDRFRIDATYLTCMYILPFLAF